ncbi:unnamed protein product [Didymodactylos carnosus]|uniref:Origin recognition complex subunit 3 N-terminal domain-containing protein n=1 Tax=Didymodactylos carnosus TaxID=1234261 RepID=A0A813RYN2_9BILA|nr:unnamed protein product [Didymodactylos carnosus]CAF3570936.1 unnamed protein product [Didymodactylos carnosus]
MSRKSDEQSVTNSTIVETYRVDKKPVKGAKTSSSHSSKEDMSLKTYLKRAKSIENVLRRIKSKLHARLIDNVIDFIRQNELFRHNHKCFEHIPTATLVMGTNISDHIQLFYELNDQIHLEFNSVLVTLNEADCVSVGKILTTTKCALNEFYPDDEDDLYFRFSKFISFYQQLDETKKRSLIFIIPEFESISLTIFENFVTLLGLQIKSISILLIVGFRGGNNSLQRLVSSRISSVLSIDKIQNSSPRKYFEHIIKALFLSEETYMSITSEQFKFLENGYLENFSLTWLEHTLKYILFLSQQQQQLLSASVQTFDTCLFNALFIACDKLPNYPLGRTRSSFYYLYLSSYLNSDKFLNELVLSINSATYHQLDLCLKVFIEHACYSKLSNCQQFVQYAHNILESIVDNADDDDTVTKCITLRSLIDKKLSKYREKVYQWIKQICKTFEQEQNDYSDKTGILNERLMPITRANFIKELMEMKFWNPVNNMTYDTPDLARLYQTYSECGTKISLVHWFESFAARFVHGLVELEYLGFTKASIQRSSHATKLIWDS